MRHRKIDTRSKKSKRNHCGKVLENFFEFEFQVVLADERIILRLKRASPNEKAFLSTSNLEIGH